MKNQLIHFNFRNQPLLNINRLNNQEYPNKGNKAYNCAANKCFGYLLFCQEGSDLHLKKRNACDVEKCVFFEKDMLGASY